MNKRFAQIRGAAKKARSYVSTKSLAVGVALAAPMASFAAGDPFTDATTVIKDKIALYGADLVVVAAAGVVFMVAIKYVKKIPRAA